MPCLNSLKMAAAAGGSRLRRIPSADAALSPLEIWCNEAQERYVLAIAPDDLGMFTAICARERCPFAVVGEAVAEPHLHVHDAHLSGTPVDLPLSVLFGKPPQMRRAFDRDTSAQRRSRLPGVTIAEAASRVLRVPAVAGKGFLVTIGDRTRDRDRHRDQMVGPWQVPGGRRGHHAREL